MTHVLNNLQSYSALRKEMVQQNHLQPSKHTGQVVRMEPMDAVVHLPMLVVEVAILVDE